MIAASRNTTKDLLACLVIAILFSLLVLPVFNTPFSVGDDHRIIAMAHPEKMEEAYVRALYNNTPGLWGSLKNDAAIGRFRPLGWAFTKLQCFLWGDNFLLWRACNVLVLFLSLYFFSALCRRFGAGNIAVWTILCVYAFGRNNETWWTLIPPAQNTGELFLLAGALSWVVFRAENKTPAKYAAVLLLLCASLVKESFIFCIPFLWLADFFFLSPDKKLFTKDSFLLFIVFMLPFISLISVIFTSRKIYSYPYPDPVPVILGYNAWQFFYSSVFLLAPALMFFLRSHIITRRNLIKLALLLSSWLVVQLVLLKGIKMDDQHHYLVPGLLLVLLVSAVSIQYISARSKKIFYAVTAFYLAFSLWQAKNTFVNAGFYSARVKSFYDMVEKIRSAPRAGIAYFTEEPLAGDWLMGTSAILRWKGVSAALYFNSYACYEPEWIASFKKTRPALTFPPLQNYAQLRDAWVIFPDRFYVSPSKKNYTEENVSYISLSPPAKGFPSACPVRISFKGKKLFFAQPYTDAGINALLSGRTQKYCGYTALVSY